MRKVLPGTPFLVVLSFLLLSSTAFSRNYSFDVAKPKTPVKRALSVTAPADLSVYPDMSSNTATGVFLGTPVFSEDAIAISHNGPSAYPIGKTSVTWTVMDGYGNTATAVQTVTVIDNEKPKISRLGEIAVVNDAGSCAAVVKLFIPNTFDNSGQVSLTHNGPAVYPVGTTPIIWTATDAQGNTDTMVQKITVIDNELPVISISTALIQAASPAGQCGATVDLGTPDVSDNCGIVSIVNNAPAVFPVGTTIVKWTVTDLTGYKVSATQTVTVTDNEQPTITAPANISVVNEPGKNGASVNTGVPARNDNCGVESVTSNAPSFFTIGTTVVTWTVTDIHGNTATASQNVTVLDNEAPALTGVPANTTVSCENIPAIAAVAAIDNCGMAPVISFSETSTRGSNINQSSRYNYSITRTWTATDNSGNKRTAKQVITVNDKTAPAINAPSGITVGNAAGKCAATVSYTVAATDNSAGPVTLSYSKSSGSSFASGTTTVTVTARDVCGNVSTRSFQVTVNDTEKPSVTAPTNKSVSLNSGNGTSNVSLGTPITADNCGVKTISNNAPSYYPVGTTQVTWTVKDNAGNTATAVQTVTVSSRRRTNASETQQQLSSVTEENMDELTVKIGSNPTTSYFTLYLQSNQSAPVNIRVTDAIGRIVDAKSGIAGNSTVQIGHNYRQGNYFAEIIQGRQRKTIQLIKIQ